MRINKLRIKLTVFCFRERGMKPSFIHMFLYRFLMVIELRNKL